MCAAAALFCSTVQTVNNQLYLFTGEDAVSKHLDQLIKWEGEIIEHLNQNCKMNPLKPEMQTAQNNATICCICHTQNRPFDFTNPNDRKVADHDHLTKYYIGAAHDECNQKRRVMFDIPIIFHNLRVYELHLIVTALSRPEYRTREIQVIGQNMERYMQLKRGNNLVVSDSYKFLTNSLDSLVQSLWKTDVTKFQQLEWIIWTRYPTADFKLLFCKGIFPYEFLNSFDTFNERAFPLREAFFSILRGEDCLQADYDYAQRVRAIYNCRSLEDYLKLYLASDVCQLADVFENFLSIFHQNDEHDPAYFVKAPQLARNSMFKI